MSEREQDWSAGVRNVLRDPLARLWLRRIVDRGDVFKGDPETHDPTWRGRRALALLILDDCERAQPGSMAMLIQEGLDDARRREGRGEHDDVRPDAGPELLEREPGDEPGPGDGIF